MKKYDSSVKTEEARENWAQRMSVWLAYDNVGYLLREGLVEDEVVFNSAGFSSLGIWERYWPIIDYYRRGELGQVWLENFEFFAKAMWRMGKARGVPGLTHDMYKDMFEPKAAVSASQ